MIKLLFFRFVEDVGQSALAAVLTVKVSSHEHAGATLLGGTLTAQTVDLAVVVHLVVLEHGELDLPVLMLDLLGRGVILLLALLAATAQTKHQVKGRLLLDVVVRQGPSILQLLAGKDQPLLVRRNPLLVLKSLFINIHNLLQSLSGLDSCYRKDPSTMQPYLDFGLDILDGVAGLDLKGDGLPREGLDKDLHDGLLSSRGLL